ncbi:MAG TPA: hypothetical protein VG711_02850, partial [Phycisphaerales bacterium]|nr:hypothetical protein [Phycisphaerales bacterium]
MTRKPVQKLILILIVLGLCGWLIYAKGLRYGKDLQGGVSLVYAVSFPEGTSSSQKMDTLNQTIEILKKRVNPNGLLDISMQPMGTDRIEIVMPLMNDEGKRLKKAYEDALGELVKLAEIPEDKLDASLRNHTAVQDWAIPEGSDRAAKVTELQKTYDDIQTAQASLDQARSENAADDVVGLREQELARLEVKYDQEREAVLRLSLEENRITRTISLSSTHEADVDSQSNPVLDANGKPKLRPSQREAAVAILKADYGYLAGGLDKVIAAYDEYTSKRKGLEDPEDLIRLLRGAGVLDFHIAVDPAKPQGVNVDDLKQQLKEKGPDRTESTVAKWFLINDLKQWYKTPQQLQALQVDPEAYFAKFGDGYAVTQYDAQYYMLLYTGPTMAMTHGGDNSWSLTSAGQTVDQYGLPAVSFKLDAAGSALMGRMTGAHVNEAMAIVLDGQVYSAPNLQSRIDGSGIIQGQFSKPDLDYLIRVLASGALEARLSPNPISVSTIGPTIGQENLHKGLYACLVSIIAVAVFMMVYYFFAGLIANVAVLANAIFIFGVMAFMDGTFTLPGLAGIALTIGTAVDANILIYERIREE